MFVQTFVQTLADQSTGSSVTATCDVRERFAGGSNVQSGAATLGPCARGEGQKVVTCSAGPCQPWGACVGQPAELDAGAGHQGGGGVPPCRLAAVVGVLDPHLPCPGADEGPDEELCRLPDVAGAEEGGEADEEAGPVPVPDRGHGQRRRGG